MARTFVLRSKTAERAALALGAVAALSLGAVALHPVSDPTRNTQLARLQIAEGLRDAIRAHWRELAASTEWFGGVESLVSWTPREPALGPLPPPFPPPDAAGTSALAVFDTWVKEAEEFLQRGEFDAARASLERARREHVDRPREAEALESWIQLALRTEDAPTAHDTARAVLTQLQGDEVDGRSTTSLALRILLAAEPLLGANEADEAAHWLLERLEHGQLAMPPPFDPNWAEPSLPRFELEPLFSLYLDRIGELAAAAEPRAKALRERFRADELARRIGELPASIPDSGLGLRRLGQGAPARFLVWRTERGTSRLQGTIALEEDLERAVVAAVANDPRIDPDLVLDRRGDQDDAGPRLLDAPVVLVPGEFEVVLRHPDPDSLVAGQARAFERLRAGLVALAVLCLAGAWFAARALRRDRLLHEKERRFLAGVSHELRTPAASLALLSENLFSGKVQDPERVARYHRSLQDEARRLVRLVEDVLDLSRRAQGEPPPLERAEHTVAEWTADLERSLRDRSVLAEATLTVEAPANGERANFDAEALRRVVHNLVRNAVLHSGSDRIEVRVRVAEEFTLEVRDHGHGIPAAARRRVFEPFTQLDADGTKSRGTGLGLALVREIVRAHGGEVVCTEPDEGSGARFVVRLPRETEG